MADQEQESDFIDPDDFLLKNSVQNEIKEILRLDHANLISGQKIRDVCTSIELECSFENFMNIPVRRSRPSGGG